MMNIKDVKLRKDMNRNMIDSILKENNIDLAFVDYFMESVRYKHNWKCSCGNLFQRSWDSLRRNNLIYCKDCSRLKIEQRYKYEVEKDGEYEYIRAYFSGDILPNGKVIDRKPYIQVKHKYCNNVYEVYSGSFITDRNRCNKCCGSYRNSILYINGDIASLIYKDELGNDIDLKTIYPNSTSRFYFKCKYCGKVSSRTYRLTDIYQDGYSCEYCSDGISIPEKFMSNVLKQLEIKFTTQKQFKWSYVLDKNIKRKKIYDFYIPSLNMIIETHGLQHYEESNKKNSKSKFRTLEEEQENDRIKKESALNNGINHYITIDCRESTLEWLKENVIKESSPYFDLTKVDFDIVWIDSQGSICKKVWELWNEGYSIKRISEEVNVNRVTVERYLHIGKDLNLCSFQDGKDIELSYPNGDAEYFDTVDKLILKLGISKSTFHTTIIKKGKVINMDNFMHTKVKERLKKYDGCVVIYHKRGARYDVF